MNAEFGAKTAVIFTPNPEQLVLAANDPLFASALCDATINIPDGIGVVLASRLLHFFGKAKAGEAVKERISGVDLVQVLAQQFPDKKFAFAGGLGADGSMAEQTVTVSGKSIPWLPGYKNVATPTEEEEWTVREFLKKVQPDVVFVAFGAPQQEYWTLRHRQFLEHQGVKLALVVGGSIDIFTGKLKRPPTWVRKIGAEWLYRLVQEPWRWKRQLKLLTFIRLVLRELFA